jgi:membrane protein implicated in regulation of membrane protease activity
MKQRDPGSRSTSLAAIGAAAIFIVCCASGPAIVALAAGLSVAALLGAGAALIATIGLAAAVIAWRVRRRRACQPVTRKQRS